MLLGHPSKAGRWEGRISQGRKAFFGVSLGSMMGFTAVAMPTEALLPGPSALPSKGPAEEEEEEEVSLSPLASMDMLLEQSREELAGFLPDEFINLSPPQAQDYHFGLEEGEGISELFDCNFGDFTPLDF